jgi:hypothetical protein
MANRYFKSQFTYSFRVQPVRLFAKITFGAAGAPTLSANDSVGVASVARNGAGDYSITLSDIYPKFLLAKHVFDTSGTGAAPASPGMYVKSNAVASTKILRVVFNAAGTATDPASGEIVYLEIGLDNSSVTL